MWTGHRSAGVGRVFASFIRSQISIGKTFDTFVELPEYFKMSFMIRSSERSSFEVFKNIRRPTIVVRRSVIFEAFNFTNHSHIMAQWQDSLLL